MQNGIVSLEERYKSFNCKFFAQCQHLMYCFIFRMDYLCMTMCLDVMEVVSNWANKKAENRHVVDDINFSSTTFISKHGMTHYLHIRQTFNTLDISFRGIFQKRNDRDIFIIYLFNVVFEYHMKYFKALY